MDLVDVFPPTGLRIEAGPLVLRPITDDLLPALIEVALAGVHEPDRMPFFYPWTDSPPERLPTEFAQYHWGIRSRWTRDAWTLELAVEYDGTIVGTQSLATQSYLVTRSGETGSWLGRRHQGQGIGTRMRQALCAFAFDHLDAEEITSSAFDDNPASLAVSRKVGYRPNGQNRLPRRGRPALSTMLRLDPADLVRGDPITVTGAEAFRRFIGLDDEGQPRLQDDARPTSDHP